MISGKPTKDTIKTFFVWAMFGINKKLDKSRLHTNYLLYSYIHGGRCGGVD